MLHGGFSPRQTHIANIAQRQAIIGIKEKHITMAGLLVPDPCGPLNQQLSSYSTATKKLLSNYRCPNHLGIHDNRMQTELSVLNSSAIQCKVASLKRVLYY